MNQTKNPPHIYGLNDSERQWETTAATIASAARTRAAEVDEQAKYPAESMAALAEAGLFGLCLPTEFGGKGQSPAVFAAVVEQLAQACASTAMIYVMHVSAAQTLPATQTLSERASLMREVSAGRHLLTLAFSEKGSRSQFWAPVSQLREQSAGQYLTTASKSWVTAAHHADSYVAHAQKPLADSPLEATVYLIRRESAGLKVSGNFNGLGLRGNDSAPVELQDVVIRRSDLLTEPGAGPPMMLEVILPWFCIGTAAMAHGLCLAAIAATQSHLTSAGFEHVGQKLRDLPNLRVRLADMSCRTEQSRALLGYTIQQLLNPNAMTPLYVMQTRLAALETASLVTDLAMKTCGGAAFSKHLGIERLFRDARAGWVMAPTVDHLQDFIGRALTGLPLF